jgi:hypothetical protein
VGHLEEDLLAADLQLPRSVTTHLEGFLKAEAATVAADLAREVTSILAREITDIEQGASSLLYAMEALAELELATDEDLVSRVGSVIKIMKSGKGDLASLDRIRKDLLNYVKTT